MYRCPHCSAGMRYDISEKNMKCDYCGYRCDVDRHLQKQEEAARDDYEVTLFSCPQCGGQIRSTDNAAADFCSYCGASVVLEGKLVNEKKPAYIIPFSRTKEECKEVFKRCTKKVWCMPGAYKNPEKLEKFTGIYMPYWVYEVSQHAEPLLKCRRTVGNYTEFLYLDFEIDQRYKWIPYDAASGFSDDLSNMIGDYESKEIEEFSGAYLSGFYADSPDVKEETYMEDAALVSCDMTIAAVKKKYKNFDFEKVADPISTFNAKVENVKMALFPVWFLTWRDKDRVSYAVINGQTLKAAADLPVSFSKFLIFSLLFAVPFAVLFFFIPSITPPVTLWVFLLVGMRAILQNNSIAKAYISRESYLTDKGRFLSTESGRKQWIKDQEKKKARENEKAGEAERKRKTEKKHISNTIEATDNVEGSSGCLTVIIFIILYFFIAYLGLSYSKLLSDFLYYVFGFDISSFTSHDLFMILIEIVTPVIAVILSVVILIKIIWETAPKRLLLKILPDTLFLSATVAAASVIMLMQPVKDLFYYIASLVVFAGILVGYLAIFHRFNLSCSRPIPNYHERGERR